MHAQPRAHAQLLHTDATAALGMPQPAFLASTFGFGTFFKSLAVAAGTFPKGADADLRTWLTWYVSMPEPCFTKGGALVLVARGELGERAAILVVKVFGLAVLLSLLHSSPGRLPFGAGGLWSSMLNGWVHLWLIYLWAAFCLDFSTLLTMAQGLTTEPAFRNPLLASRSFSQAWSQRWNRPVHVLLKRSVYVPTRKAGVPALPAALLTFLCSGLLHEYNFALHNTPAYQPGHATVFFLLTGALMIIEDAVGPWWPEWACRLANSAPSVVIALVLQLAVLPAFTALFVKSWLASGMIEAVGELLPHWRCQ